jgi:hypothetical protein
MPACNECDGYGTIGLGHRNDPDERFGECECCGGSGERDLNFNDFDGAMVRVIATRFVGSCNVMSDGLAIVMNDEGREVEGLTFEELELVE